MYLFIKNKSMKNNIKKSYKIVIFIWLMFFVGFGFGIWNINKDATARVCSDNICFTTQLARTSSEQQLGLMNRTFIEEKNGMLFIFSESKLHNFWMKNTLIPLDILRIDEGMNVVKIITAQPCTEDPCVIYQPWVAAKYVLEINAWIATKYGIKEWTYIKFMNIF